MKNGGTKVTRRRYDADFKQNILTMHANGRSIRSLSEAFGINENLLYKWKRLSNTSTSKEKKDELE